MLKYFNIKNKQWIPLWHPTLLYTYTYSLIGFTGSIGIFPDFPFRVFQDLPLDHKVLSQYSTSDAKFCTLSNTAVPDSDGQSSVMTASRQKKLYAQYHNTQCFIKITYYCVHYVPGTLTFMHSRIRGLNELQQDDYVEFSEVVNIAFSGQTSGKHMNP